jgi:hypothetical protein
MKYIGYSARTDRGKIRLRGLNHAAKRRDPVIYLGVTYYNQSRAGRKSV